MNEQTIQVLNNLLRSMVLNNRTSIQQVEGAIRKIEAIQEGLWKPGSDEDVRERLKKIADGLIRDLRAAILATSQGMSNVTQVAGALVIFGPDDAPPAPEVDVEAIKDTLSEASGVVRDVGDMA